MTDQGSLPENWTVFPGGGEGTGSTAEVVRDFDLIQGESVAKPTVHTDDGRFIIREQELVEEESARKTAAAKKPSPDELIKSALGWVRQSEQKWHLAETAAHHAALFRDSAKDEHTLAKEALVRLRKFLG